MDLTARLRLDDQFSSRLRSINSGMSRLQSATQRSSSGMKQFTSSFAGLAGAIGATAALAGSMMLVKNSISSAFDRIDTMERFERTMTTMLGTSEKAKAALKGLSAVVDGTAYGLDTAARSVQNFVSRGIEVKKATSWFEAMGDAVAFYGDGSNEQLEGVSSAMSKMLSSGKVSMQQMETLYIAGIDGPGIYAKAVGKSTAEVQKALSSGKIDAESFFDVVTTAMLEGTNSVQKIAGTAKDAGATWAGAIANMKFAVVRGVTTIITSIDEMLANNGLPSLRDMVSAFGKKFESVLKSAASTIQPFIDRVKSIYEAIKPFAPVFKAAALGIGVFVGAMFAVSATLSIISALAGAIAFLASPIGLAVLAVSGLVLGFMAAYKYSETFRNAIDGAVGAVKGFFKAMDGEYKNAHDIMEKAGLSPEAASKVMTFARDVKDAVADIQGAYESLSTMTPVDIAKTLGMSPETIAQITSTIDTVKASFDSIGDTFNSLFEAVQPGIESILGALSGFSSTVTDVFTTLMSVLQPIFSGIATAFSIIGDAATIVFTNVVVPAIDLVVWAFKTLWKVVGPILELLGAAIELAFTMLKVMWDNVISPFVGFLTGEFATAVSKTTGGVDSIGDAFDFVGGIISTVAGYVRDFASALANVKIPDWVGNIGGKIKSATGAVTNFMGIGGPAKSNYHGLERVPYDGYYAKLHRGETILNRQQADAYERMQSPQKHVTSEPVRQIAAVTNVNDYSRNMQQSSDVINKIAQPPINVASAAAPKINNVVDFPRIDVPSVINDITVNVPDIAQPVINVIAEATKVSNVIQFPRSLTCKDDSSMDDRYSYDDLTGGDTTYNNQSYSNVTTTQAERSGGKPGNVTLHVTYQGGKDLDESEMLRFADFLATNIIAAGEGGAY